MEDNNNTPQTENYSMPEFNNEEPKTEAAPVETPAPEPQCENNCETKKKCQCNCRMLQYVIVGVLFAAVIGLYILYFCGNCGSKHNPNATPAVVSKDGALKVAYVDSDSLLKKYQYAIDMEKELNAFKTAKENDYKNQMQKLQNDSQKLEADYKNYLSTGDKLTLSQQQSTEAELKKRQNDLQARAQKVQSLEMEYTMQIQERQLKENEKLLKAIFAFIAQYNSENQQFDIILRHTFSDSPTLYVNPGMDITDEIIEGLNKEYKEVKGKMDK